MRTIFILLPSPNPTGPIKGGYALANALAPLRRVVIVFLKQGPGVDAPLDQRVEVISLAGLSGGWRARLETYRALLRDAGGRSHVGSVSMCLSADWINRFCREHAVTCASVRGNLPQNYRLDYGWPGTFLALGHLLALRAFDHVVAMTSAMAKQVYTIAALRAEVIGNFLDEAAIDGYRQAVTRPEGPLRFVFVGSLSRRKQPRLIIDAMEILRSQNAQLDIIGDGPLRGMLEDLIQSKGLRDFVRIHGHLADPYPIIADSDAFVLPSHSEGVSRAALEALHLGVPCVLREVDGNAELLAMPGSGVLFNHEESLADAMLKAAALTRSRPVRTSLLPPVFRQAVAAGQYLALLEQTA
ncbi:MAG: glycosyltransferase [Ferrovibrio sp.]|uniref:glycosyltransferase n=1 Tax=Ferrovibrio sp. TaxID=1917215 RepID=UPI0039193533